VTWRQYEEGLEDRLADLKEPVSKVGEWVGRGFNRSLPVLRCAGAISAACTGFMNGWAATGGARYNAAANAVA
jgi:hypothetical protein